LPLVLTRLASHPVFFSLYWFLFLFSNSYFFTTLLSSLLIIVVINCSTLRVHKAKLADIGRCNALMQCGLFEVAMCEQVWMAGQGVSPYVRYGTNVIGNDNVIVKKRVRVQYIRQTIQVLHRTSSTRNMLFVHTFFSFCWSPPVWCW